jgi:hypothetical protein
MSKIAFCFLIVDKIHNHKLWENFFQDVDENKYSIYIHFKKNFDLGKFNKYKLKNCVPTKWGTISLVHAHNTLFQEAYKDVNNIKFISLSGNCVPVKNFDHIYDFLIKDNKAYFSSFAGKENECFPRCNSLLKYFPKESIKKSSNWFILNRTIVEKVCLIPIKEIKSKFETVICTEEHYYITLVHFYNLLEDVIITSGSENDTTFTNWGGTYKYGCNPKNSHPKLYTEITKEEWDYLKSSPCLFGRKFIDRFLILDKPRPLCVIQ